MQLVISLSCPLLPTLVKMSAGRHVRVMETGCSSSHAMSSDVGLRAGGRPSELSPPLWQTKDRSLVTTLQVAAAVTHLRDGGSHYIVSAGSRGSRLPETDAMAAGKTIYSLATESLVNDTDQGVDRIERGFFKMNEAVKEVHLFGVSCCSMLSPGADTAYF